MVRLFVVFAKKARGFFSLIFSLRGVFNFDTFSSLEIFQRQIKVLRNGSLMGREAPAGMNTLPTGPARFVSYDCNLSF